MLVSADQELLKHVHGLQVFSQLSEENVGRWSSDEDTVYVNKLFGVTYGCSPLLLLLIFFHSGHVFVVIRGAWSHLAAK